MKPAVAYLGVSTIDVDSPDLSASVKDTFGVTATKGAFVSDLASASPAADAGLQQGDVIVEVAQESVTNAADVKKRVDQVRKDGKKSVLLLVSNADGELRFVAVNVQ